MDCDQIKKQLSAFVDGSLDAASSAAVEAHLSECDRCRSEHDALVSLNAALAHTFRPERARSQQLAARVIEQLGHEGLSRALPSEPLKAAPSRRRILALLVAAAAALLVAVGLFGWWSTEAEPIAKQPAVDSPDPGEIESPRNVPLAARLVLATGPVMIRAPAQKEWVSVEGAALEDCGCSPASTVKTESGTLCELETAAGSRVRMNASCEIVVHSGEELELVQGQIWCRAADDASLRVIAGTPAASTEASAEAELSFVCEGNAASVASCSSGQPLQVAAAEGQVKVIVDGREQSLTAGTICRIVDGEIAIREAAEELLREQRWMQPLLVLANPEQPPIIQKARVAD